MYKLVRKLAVQTIRWVADACELLLIDLTYGKGKYRSRGARLRPIIHRTYNHRTVVIREPAPIVYKVKSKE